MVPHSENDLLKLLDLNQVLVLRELATDKLEKKFVWEYSSRFNRFIFSCSYLSFLIIAYKM